MYLQVSVWLSLSPACSKNVFSLARVKREREDYLGNNQLYGFSQRFGKSLVKSYQFCTGSSKNRGKTKF